MMGEFDFGVRLIGFFVGAAAGIVFIKNVFEMLSKFGIFKSMNAQKVQIVQQDPKLVEAIESLDKTTDSLKAVVDDHLVPTVSQMSTLLTNATARQFTTDKAADMERRLTDHIEHRKRR